MAGIYIHIPFCKTKCSYCNFYSINKLEYIEDYISALKKEINLKQNFFKTNSKIETIYFGGGTPSLLSINQIEDILCAIYKTYNVISTPEITFEMNPDDVSNRFAKELSKTVINRLSLGIQSFDNTALALFNRRHSSDEAQNAIDILQNNGFNNISVDLIYGIPNIDLHVFEKTLEQFINLNVQHISAYDLIYERGTKLHDQLLKKEFSEIDEDINFQQYQMLVSYFRKNGMIQYELSNFSRNNMISTHNSNYWNIDVEYLGLGASAHSYNIKNRLWNISNVNKYINNINSNESYYEEEYISEISRVNEYILTSLRTVEGLDLNYVKSNFREKYCKDIFRNVKLLENKYKDSCKLTNQKISLTDRGMFLSDKIIVELIQE